MSVQSLSAAVGIFGLNCSKENSKLILLPVPWDATCSYHRGTHLGPEQIREASPQLDLYDALSPNFFEAGIFMLDEPEAIKNWNESASVLTTKAVEQIANLQSAEPNLLSEINLLSQQVTAWVRSQSKVYLGRNQIVGVIGGEHSVPLGLIQSLNERHQDFGILHIDAHHDLRVAYQGFDQSHASIMWNVLKSCEYLSRLTSVGIRDYADSEHELAANDPRVVTFYDRDIKRKQFAGLTWQDLCAEIIATLPQKVYISFDIDGMSPDLCPGTGTPVPGGLSFEQVDYLLQCLFEAGKSIIGFDLCEVANRNDSDWDANVGARVLFQLSRLCLAQRA